MPGKGTAPEWFKADKYVSVDEQAKAYSALEKRMGSFVGAPKDGKYDNKLPEGITLEMTADHPLLTDFTKWAGENQLNQAGFSQLLGMLAQYEAAQLPDMAAIKARVGANADARLAAVNSWAVANLDAATLGQLRAASTGNNADSVFAVVEALIGKSNQAALPKPGSDIPPPPKTTNEAYDAAMKQKDPVTGKLLYFTDPQHRLRTEAMANNIVGAAGPK